MVAAPENVMRICIVGSGLGGEATAFALRKPGREIVLLEQSSLNREIGAALSLQANASRIVNKWGIATELAKGGAVEDAGFQIYGTDGNVVRAIPFGQRADGAQRVVYHRQDLHEGLKRLITKADGDIPAVEIRTSSRVLEVDPAAGSVTLENGTVLDGFDLIIGADGIHSKVREAVAGKDVKPEPTGLSAYRFMLKSSTVTEIPEMQKVVRTKPAWTTMILGQDRRIVMGPCRDGTMLGIVALVPDKHMHEESTGSSWTSAGSKEELLKSFEDFPAWIRQLFDLAPTLGLWQLRDTDPLKTWCKDRAVLIGDSCHAMLPLQGQGASQAIEDAEALGALFDDIDGKPTLQQIKDRTQAYFVGRYDRATLIQSYSRAQGRPLAPGNPADDLNPMEFDQYNSSYYGIKEWFKSHPELVEKLPESIVPAVTA